ncbi:MAG: hypothetical protein ACN6N5_06930, partial [Diaphorobacter nitroreducens]
VALAGSYFYFSISLEHSTEQVLRSLALTRSEGASDYRRKGVCECHRTGILNRGFRWARAARRWVHLTRDDHAHRAMYQARAQ